MPTAAQPLRATHSSSLTFREITREPELFELFRLRHLVYSHQGYWDWESQQLDIDSYDAHSRFIGAFTATNQLVGGARYIEAEGATHQKTLESLTRRLKLAAPAPRKHRYTAEALWDFSPLVQQAHDQGKTLVEFGRTVMHPDWQGSGLGRWLVFALYGLALHNGESLGLALVPPRLLGFYGRCGCVPLPRDGSAFFTHTELVPVKVDLAHLGPAEAGSQRARRDLGLHGSWVQSVETQTQVSVA